jgi:hypothetical protein
LSTTDPPGDRTIRPFAAILQEVGAGRLHDRVSEQLADVTAAVAATGKKGTVTLVVTVEPLKGGKSKAGITDTLVVTGKSAAKVPEGDDSAPTSVFFHDASGNLVRNDPNQPELPIRGLNTVKEATA